MLFAEEIARIIAKELKLAVPQIMDLLEIPPDPKLGDVAFPCFSLAKELKKAPAKIAEELALKLQPDSPVDTIQSFGPYVNFFLNKAILAQTILTKKPLFPKRKKKVMVEHANANTHKAAHVGHLRNMVLGDSVVRMLKAAGYSVVNCYYINDTGMHVAKCLWGLLNDFKDEKEPTDKKLQWLGNVYTKSSQKIKAHPDLKKEADEVLQRLENGDPQIQKLWKKTWQWSIDDWHRIFKMLEMLPFDAKFYDSVVTPKVPEIIDTMLEKGILKESQGAIIADLEEYKLNTVIIKKSDGTLPYIAKDFALAEVKFNEYNIDKSVYVVGSEQELHFSQLFKILELNGFKQAKECFHLSYGLVMLKTGKMSSREGTVIFLDKAYNETYAYALKQVVQRHQDWSESKQQKTAKGITLSAIKFPMLLQEPNKKIIFDIEKALDFEGETGPYVQYAYARLSSLLKKHGKKISDNIDYSLFKESQELELIKLIQKEAQIIEEAALKYRPALVARYALEIAQSFNTFYHALQVLNAQENIKKARLLLLLKVKDVLTRVLPLLGMPLLEQM